MLKLKQESTEIIISKMLEKHNSIRNFGQRVGFLFSYLVFTTILYFILTLLNKLPNDWSYLSVVLITLAIVIIGFILKKVLK